MTEKERDGRFNEIAEQSHKWLHLWEAIEFDGRPEFATNQRQEMKPLEADILRLAEEIKAADLAEAHHDAMEGWDR